MSINLISARLAHHRITTTTDVPTIPASADFTDGTWIETDINPGEIMFNMTDDKSWFRSDNGIIELFNEANSLIPDTTNAYDIGSSSLLWRKLYLLGHAQIGVNHTVNSTQSLVIGEEVTLNVNHINTYAQSSYGPTGAIGKTSLYQSTANATPTLCDITGATPGFVIESNMVYQVTVKVVACDNSGNAIEYAGSCLIKNIGGTTSFVGVPAMVSTFGDGALAATAVNLIANNTNDRLDVEVTGIAATGINWTVDLDWTRTAKV